MISDTLHAPGSFLDVHQQTFDVLVLGGGYIGLAVALQQRQLGQKVLLVEPRGDLVWESGRAMFTRAGSLDHPLWQQLVREVDSRMSVTQPGWLDPALAEVVATKLVAEAGLSCLYYAWPVMLEQSHHQLTSLIVATKSGYRRLVARRFVDATEAGTLIRLLNPNLPERALDQGIMSAFLQRRTWPADASDRFLPTPWETQRQYEVTVTTLDPALARATLLETLIEDEPARDTMMSHAGVQPYPLYKSGSAMLATPGALPGVPRVPGNLCITSPSLADESLPSLADRFALGLQASKQLERMTPAEPDRELFNQTIPSLSCNLPDMSAQVLVAGGGTGGALAALASAQTGATTICIEPLNFLGGIGAGGGIHAYYYGVTGGLQQTLDRKIKDLMQRSGKLLTGGSFNPDAKKYVLEQALHQAGVQLHLNSCLAGLEKSGNTITAALVATDHGLVRMQAKAYIDGTGDGDLCAMAGATFTHGRSGDGLPHAYSQSGGMLHYKANEDPGMTIVNFDAGWCDATDAQDLTRARMVGLLHYLKDHYTNLERPTYLAPAIGLRQSRQVVTDHVLSLDDLVIGRRFEDVIGYSGCHYDNHAVDYDQESDEALFWIWLNRNWRNPVAAQMPYRMLLPKGLDNVWIASRCAGVSQDAHHSLRMQRDMQRIGEAAGIAAALCATAGTGSRLVNHAELKRLLLESGALNPPEKSPSAIFGLVLEPEVYEPGYFERNFKQALADLDAGQPGRSIWWLYRHPETAQQAVRERVTSENQMVSWLAAGILAMWDDPMAEPRLLRAIDDMEYGFDGDMAKVAGHLRSWEQPMPEKNPRLAPSWLVATGLLRCCGTARCLPSLEKLAMRDLPVIGVRATIAATLGRLIDKGRLTDVSRLVPMLDRLLEGTLVDAQVPPQRKLGGMAQLAARGHLQEAQKTAGGNPHGLWMAGLTGEDHDWQLHFTVATARAALGLPIQPQAQIYLSDPRKLVRDAFTRVQARLGIKLQMPVREKVVVKQTRDR